MKDFNGNEVHLDDTVIFTDHTGQLKNGKVCDLRQYGVGIVNNESKGLPIYWRKEKEIAKVIEIPQEDKVYITPDMYPTGKEPKCLIHEDER
ncbi:MAG: hypothetical protein GY797_06140, partial [Deltaproteobacteria bacterium]|nr:hypothetical protein [Deltaproteobacteria bacterium]